jgi:hypothetical protein
MRSGLVSRAVSGVNTSRTPPRPGLSDKRKPIYEASRCQARSTLLVHIDTAAWRPLEGALVVADMAVLQVVATEQATHVEVRPQARTLQSVNDDAGTTPGGAGRGDQILGCDRLAAGVDPIVDEQHPGMAADRAALRAPGCGPGTACGAYEPASEGSPFLHSSRWPPSAHTQSFRGRCAGLAR